MTTKELREQVGDWNQRIDAEESSSRGECVQLVAAYNWATDDKRMATAEDHQYLQRISSVWLWRLQCDHKNSWYYAESGKAVVQ